MHPIVIMSYDKSPAINKAVQILEEAGLEVKVLNTKSAKLVEFLGALAGEDNEIDPPQEPIEKKTDAAPAEEPEESEEDIEQPEEKVKEQIEPAYGSIFGEQIIIKYVDSDINLLFPNSVSGDIKTLFSLNESQFTVWPNEQAICKVDLELNSQQMIIDVKICEQVMNPPELHLSSKLSALKE